MTEQEMREMAVEVAKSHLGAWYIWGGDDPSGFDCSGMVIECLRSVGVLPRSGDWTAHSLATDFLWPRISPQNISMGDLVFWENGSGRVIHVEMMVNRELSIGASGGGSKTVSREMAIRHNAFIKIRPYITRANLWGFLDPYK